MYGFIDITVILQHKMPRNQGCNYEYVYDIRIKTRPSLKSNIAVEI